MTNSQPTQSYKQLTPEDKKILYISLLTFLGFLVFWRSSGFMSAVAMVFFIYFLYFTIKAIRKKSERKKSILIAIPLFLLTALTMPPSNNQQINQNEKPKASVNTKSEKKEIKSVKEKTTKEKSEKIASWYQVTSVVDGDTIKIDKDGKTETIRLIGVDAPETQATNTSTRCYGREASSRMQHYVQSKKVRIEADKSQGDRDTYGRLLRYVYVEDGTNIAKAMITDGAAKEYTYKKAYKNQKAFKSTQKKAKNTKKGLWAKNTCNGNIKQTDPKVLKEQEEKKKAETAAIKAEQERQAQEQAAAAAAAEAERQRQLAAQQEQAEQQSLPSSASSSTYYPNCAAARAAGAAPVYAGQPGYGSHLDRDHDGIGCE